MVVVPAERWLFSLVLLVFRIPGFSLGFTTAIALVISVLVAGIWLLGSKSVSDLDNHDLETNPNRIIESDEKVLKMSKPDNSIFDDAYQCGWVYVTSEYKAPTSVSLSVLQQVRKGITSRYFRRPKGIFFCVLKHNSLFFFENEEQVS